MKKASYPLNLFDDDLYPIYKFPDVNASRPRSSAGPTSANVLKSALENCDDSQTISLCRHCWRRDRRLGRRGNIGGPWDSRRCHRTEQKALWQDSGLPAAPASGTTPTRVQ